MMAKQVSARNFTFLKSKSALNARGYSLVNESFGKTQGTEKIEMR